MGCISSVPLENKNPLQKIEEIKETSEEETLAFAEIFTVFNEFIDDMCVVGDDQHVSMQKLECAFAYHLKKTMDLSNAASMFTSTRYLRALCSSRGFERTPGIYFEGLMYNIKVEYLLGLSVVRFKKGVIAIGIKCEL